MLVLNVDSARDGKRLRVWEKRWERKEKKRGKQRFYGRTVNKDFLTRKVEVGG